MALGLPGKKRYVPTRPQCWEGELGGGGGLRPKGGEIQTGGTGPCLWLVGGGLGRRKPPKEERAPEKTLSEKGKTSASKGGGKEKKQYNAT